MHGIGEYREEEEEEEEEKKKKKGGRNYIPIIQNRKMIHDGMQEISLVICKAIESGYSTRVLYNSGTMWQANTQSHLSFVPTIRQTNQFSTSKRCKQCLSICTSQRRHGAFQKSHAVAVYDFFQRKHKTQMHCKPSWTRHI